MIYDEISSQYVYSEFKKQYPIFPDSILQQFPIYFLGYAIGYEGNFDGVNYYDSPVLFGTGVSNAALQNMYNIMNGYYYTYQSWDFFIQAMKILFPSTNIPQDAARFRDMVLAAQTYTGQISSKLTLLNATADATAKNYETELRDKTESEKQNLQLAKLQIFQAIENESRSAQRDFASQLLTAKNIQINLKGVINA